MTTKGFEMGFFGRNPFGTDARKKFQEEWSKMSDSEKLEFMNKRISTFENHENHFSVEAIDARCEEWMKKSPEEKEAFANERKEAFKNRMNHMEGFFERMHR